MLPQFLRHKSLKSTPLASTSPAALPAEMPVSALPTEAEGKPCAKNGTFVENRLTEAQAHVGNSAAQPPVAAPNPPEKTGGGGARRNASASSEEGPRPPLKLSDFQRGMATVLMASGIGHRQIALYVNCSRSTIDRLANLDDEVKKTVPAVRRQLFLLPLQQIMEQSKTNLKAAIWLADFHLNHSDLISTMLAPKTDWPPLFRDSD